MHRVMCSMFQVMNKVTHDYHGVKSKAASGDRDAVFSWVFCNVWDRSGTKIKIPADFFHNLLELLGL